MVRRRRSNPPDEGGNKTLTLTGCKQYSMVGYAHNPIMRWSQVTVVPDVAAHLLEQVSTDPRTKQAIPSFQEGVVKPPVRVAKTEVSHHNELRTKKRKGKNLDPNAALPEDERPAKDPAAA